MAQHPEEVRSAPRTGLSTMTRRVLASVVAAGALTVVGQPLVANAAEIDKTGVHSSGEQQTVQTTTNGVDHHSSAVRLLVNKTPMTQPAVSHKAAPQEATPQAASTGYTKPVDGKVTSGAGERGGSEHDGVDIANSIGTPVHSVTGGDVVSAGPASGFGQWVRVQGQDGVTTIYGHVNTINVKVGQHVSSGQQVATLGNKGDSTGPHLHFGAQKGSTKIDPVAWLRQHGVTL